MHVTNKFGLPEVIVEAVKNDPYDPGRRGGKYISVTTLTNPPQLTKLLWKHAEDLEEDASERIWSLLGQSVHSVIERAASSEVFRDKVIAEERFYAELAGWTIGGQVDIYDVERAELSDFKVTSVYSAKGELKTSWRRQVNILAYLLRKNGHEVKEGRIVAILKDWSRTKALYDSSYPPHPTAVIPVELVDNGPIEAFIRRQLAELESDTPRPCSDEERWRSGGNWAIMRGDSIKWAVMREGRKSAVRVYEREDEALLHVATDPALSLQKRRTEDASKRRAVKLFDSLVEAESFIAAHPEGNFHLEGREAVYTRCESYCPVRTACPQVNQDGHVFTEYARAER